MKWHTKVLEVNPYTSLKRLFRSRYYRYGKLVGPLTDPFADQCQPLKDLTFIDTVWTDTQFTDESCKLEFLTHSTEEINVVKQRQCKSDQFVLYSPTVSDNISIIQITQNVSTQTHSPTPVSNYCGLEESDSELCKSFRLPVMISVANDPIWMEGDAPKVSRTLGTVASQNKTRSSGSRSSQDTESHLSYLRNVSSKGSLKEHRKTSSESCEASVKSKIQTLNCAVTCNGANINSYDKIVSNPGLKSHQSTAKSTRTKSKLSNDSRNSKVFPARNASFPLVRSTEKEGFHSKRPSTALSNDKRQQKRYYTAQTSIKRQQKVNPSLQLINCRSAVTVVGNSMLQEKVRETVVKEHKKIIGQDKKKVEKKLTKQLHQSTKSKRLDSGDPRRRSVPLSECFSNSYAPFTVDSPTPSIRGNSGHSRLDQSRSTYGTRPGGSFSYNYQPRKTTSHDKPATKLANQDQSKTARSGGALPDVDDKFACPTKRHSDSRPDKPCLCLMVKGMVMAQSGNVLHSWHNQSEADLTGRGCQMKCSPPGPSGSERKLPTLPHFRLTKPTKMVRGGQGTVAWVTNYINGRAYALKFKLREDKSDNTWEIERRESRLLRSVKCEFIVQLYHVFETKDAIFMALELLEGGCLWNQIARIGPLAEPYALYYTACILASLRYLHSRKIIYRDMKAENVVLDTRGRPKLIDFGMAKRIEQYRSTSRPRSRQDQKSNEPDNGEVEQYGVDDDNDFDKPPTRYYFASYLAPEIYDHDDENGYSIDSWGLGYILTELTLGYGIFLSIPWESEEDNNHLDDDWTLQLLPNDTLKLSAACNDLIHKTLVRKPTDRLNLEGIVKHRFFLRVPWSKLARIRGPDLSKNQSKDSKTINAQLKSARHDTQVAKQPPAAPDMAFLQDFFGASNAYMAALFKNPPNYYLSKKAKLQQEANAAAVRSFAPMTATRNQNSSANKHRAPRPNPTSRLSNLLVNERPSGRRTVKA